MYVYVCMYVCMYVLYSIYIENVVYLITRKKCKKQLVRSITRFRTRFNNYHSYNRKFCRGLSVIQVSFDAHFMLDGHCGINDWEIIVDLKWI